MVELVELCYICQSVCVCVCLLMAKRLRLIGRYNSNILINNINKWTYILTIQLTGRPEPN